MFGSNMFYSAADHRRVSDLFGVQVLCLQITGQLPVQLDNWLPLHLRTLGSFLSRFYCAFLIFQSVHLAVLFIKTTFDTLALGVLEDISDALTLAVIYSFSSFATCYWLWHSRALLRFLKRINSDYQHHSLAGLTYVSAYAGYAKARQFTIWWMCACTTGVVFWGIAPIILRVRMLPLHCWYPFDAMQPRIYELIYALQLHAQINMGNTFGNGGALLMSATIVLLAQFDVLYCSLKNLYYHSRLLSDEDLSVLRKLQQQLPPLDGDEPSQYIVSQEQRMDLRVLARLRGMGEGVPMPLQQALHKSLVKCVQHHEFLLDCCNTLEQLFSPYCLIKSIQITMQLCLLVFVGVEGERSMMRTLSLIQYVSLTCFELFIFTYCGQLLRHHSARAGEAFWRSQWWTYAHAMCQDVLIFLTNSRRVVKLTAGNFYVMDVDRLCSVVTQAISFLTLLQKLAEKKEA